MNQAGGQSGMRKAICVLFFIVILVSVGGCTYNDPAYDVYTMNIYPGSGGPYQIGSATDPYGEGYFTDIIAGNINLGGASLLIPAFGEMYITVPVATSLTLADTFYKALGTTTPGEQLGFTSLDTGRMTYNDVTPDRICLITGAMSLSVDAPNVIISAKLYINGLPSASSLIKIKLLATGDIDTVAMIALALLQPGDYIEVWIASDKAGVEVTLEGLNFTATTVD